MAGIAGAIILLGGPDILLSETMRGDFDKGRNRARLSASADGSPSFANAVATGVGTSPPTHSPPPVIGSAQTVRRLGALDSGG